MRRPLITVAASAAALMLLLPVGASAHPDHGQDSSKEHFPGEGVFVEGDKQHGGDEGHLDPVSYGVEVVGKGAVSPAEGGLEGRVADVYAAGDYAYLTSFRGNGTDDCVGGVFVMDISDLSNPTEVPDSFIPTSPGSYAGEGVQVIEIGDRDVLIHQNETCPGATGLPAGTTGGINLWDVTDPTEPVALAMHAGDKDGGLTANTVHSFYAWYDHKAKKTWAALVDNEEVTDVDIMDISDPTNPVMVNDTLDFEALFGVSQDSPAGLTSIFAHDMDVVKLGSKYIMSLNYWDGGYLIVDVTDPTPGNVKLIAQSDYAELDEERLKRGHEISPEGNAHQSELSPDGRFLIGTDEDFNPFRIVATIDTGRYAGTEFRAVQAGGTPAISEEQTISGASTYVGLGCEPIPAGTGTALVERGVCAFQVKLDNITAAGYTAGIVFNNNVGCEAYVNMLAASDTVPFVFVNRTTGLQMLGVDPTADPCTVATPAVGTTSSDVTIKAVFDGWGYVRLFETRIPRSPQKDTGSITQLDTYAVEESQDADFAVGFGDLSVHEVAMDPNRRLAYLSYYAAGFRVIEYNKRGMKEVGAFIDEGGNNFWGVEVIERDGETYVLASDRDYGLYVFQTP